MKTIAILMTVLLAFAIIPMIAAEDSVDSSLSEDIEVVDAGITPDSAFYGLERAMERLNLAFTFNKVKRAEKRISIAEERLAEAEQMLEEDKFEAAEIAQELHDSSLEAAEQEVEEIGSNGDEDTAEQALGDVERVQLRLLTHSEKVTLVHERILNRLSQNENVSSEQLEHLSEVFAKIEAKAQEMEQKMNEKRENVRTRYKVLSEKNETELSQRESGFLARVGESKQNREEANVSGEGIRDRIREEIQDRIRDETEKDDNSDDLNESDDSGKDDSSDSEDDSNSVQRGR